MAETGLGRGEPGPLPHMAMRSRSRPRSGTASISCPFAPARLARSTLSVMLWSCLIGAPPLLLLAVAMGEQVLPATALGWAAVAGLGLAHVFGQGSIAWALGRLPASIASVTVLVQPVIAAVLAYLIFSEALTPLQAAGGALALVGVVVAQQAPARSVKPAP